MIPAKIEHEASVAESPRPQVKEIEVTSKRASSRSPRRVRKRSIRFNTTIHNRRIPHLNDLSDEVIHATWIRPEEYLEIRKGCIMTVKKMMRGQLTPEDVEKGFHSPRGLEGKTREGAAKRREHKLDSIAAVLEEQTLQWNEDVEDDEAIMEVYSVFSIPCGETAYQIGLTDAEEAQRHHFHQDNEQVSSSAPSTTATTTSSGADLTAVDENQQRGPGVLVDKLRDIVFLRSCRAALLQDIEKSFYEEASIERRRTRRESLSATCRNNTLAQHVRDYFSTQPLYKDGRLPSLELDSTDDEQSSSEGSDNEIFTSQLQDIFHSRRRKQALLDEIERGYHFEPTPIVAATSHDEENEKRTSHVSDISQSLGSRLKDILYSRKSRAAVLNELGTNSLKRQ